MCKNRKIRQIKLELRIKNEFLLDLLHLWSSPLTKKDVEIDYMS